MSPSPALLDNAGKTTLGEWELRLARDDDAEGLIALIGGVFAEYPGCVLDVDGEEPELRGVASAFQQRSGCFWVATRQERIVGCIGLAPLRPPGSEGGVWVELKKLYVAASERRAGLGSALCGLFEMEAERRKARHWLLWTDTRFTKAHAFYRARGFVRTGRTRELHDRSATVEYELARTPRAC